MSTSALRAHQWPGAPLNAALDIGASSSAQLFFPEQALPHLPRLAEHGGQCTAGSCELARSSSTCDADDWQCDGFRRDSVLTPSGCCPLDLPEEGAELGASACDIKCLAGWSWMRK